MSTSNTIKFLFNIKDEFLIEDDKILPHTLRLDRNTNAKCIYFKSVSTFGTCPHCGKKAKRFKQYHTVSIKHYNLDKQLVILKIKKKQYYCDHSSCPQKTFYENISIVDKHCHISKDHKYSITMDLKNVRAFTEIARDHHVSEVTVRRELDKYASPKLYPYLSEVICIDEFKSTSGKNKYACIIGDPVSKRIIDVLDDRRLDHLEKHFNQYSKNQRKKVRFVCMDLWSPYKSLVKKCFPKAKVVADKFHYQRVVNKAFNSIRIEILKTIKDDHKRRLIKRNWKLLNTYYLTVQQDNRKHYYRILHRYGRRQDLLDEILEANEELFKAWEVYQDFLQILKNPNLKHDQKYQKLIDWSLRNQSNDNPLYRTAATTIYQWRHAIYESFIPHNGMTLSNGFIEGKNNRIKHLKRTGYGYRSFVHFKKRILLIDSPNY